MADPFQVLIDKTDELIKEINRLERKIKEESEASPQDNYWLAMDIRIKHTHISASEVAQHLTALKIINQEQIKSKDEMFVEYEDPLWDKATKESNDGTQNE